MAAKIDSQSETSMTGCQKFVNWILCCRDQEDEINQSIGTKGDQPAMELPGYLNRFDFDGGSTGRNKSNWSGSDDDISASDSLKKYKNKMQGRVLDGNSVASSENIHSECDSGLGSASDSGRGKSDNSDKSDKDGSSSENEKTPEEMENIKRLQSLVRKSEIVVAQPTYQQAKPVTKKACDSNSTSEDEKVTKNGTGKNDGTRDRRKPKRNESTLSRFSSIFGGHGRNLTEVLVEEFRLNDRFSGLSMDRIWGGFMDEIKEEGEDGKVPEPETPETKARRALNEKTKKRRRRRARNQMAPSAVKTTRAIQPKSFKRQKSRKHWQQELPQDWQDVIAL